MLSLSLLEEIDTESLGIPSACQTNLQEVICLSIMLRVFYKRANLFNYLN